MADQKSKGGVAEAPTQELSDEFKHLMTVLAGRVMSGATDKVGDFTEKLTGNANGASGPTGKAVSKAGEKLSEGKSPLSAGLSAGVEGIKSKVSGIFGGGGGKGKGGGKKLKVTNIIEEIDIGAPIDVVYNQWTQFQDFSGFMKKVENVNQEEEEQVTFKAQVLWSHREWKATIIDQVPEKHIVWRSSGQKGHVDGAVTFHELAPDLTRVLVVLEYHPQGLFERTGNIWRAQGRRVRLELKHFRRHVMTETMLHPDELEGWRGEIHDSEVTKSHEDAMAEQEDENSEDSEENEEDEGSDGAEDEYDEDDEAEDEYDEAEDEDDEESDEDEDDEPDDEYDEDDEAEDEYDDEDEEDEDEEEPPPARRSRRRAGAGRR
ncbi:MAG TPA: SRPBCC family protein [Jatrophihabitans sp.]|nr:SRPBCC family protein [Jatrophihabitans sp.]